VPDRETEEVDGAEGAKVLDQVQDCQTFSGFDKLKSDGDGVALSKFNFDETKTKSFLGLVKDYSL
jgi:hypothetical protein